MDFMFVSIKEDRRGKKAIKGEQKEKVKYESGQNGEWEVNGRVLSCGLINPSENGMLWWDGKVLPTQFEFGFATSWELQRIYA